MMALIVPSLISTAILSNILLGVLEMEKNPSFHSKITKAQYPKKPGRVSWTQADRQCQIHDKGEGI